MREKTFSMNEHRTNHSPLSVKMESLLMIAVQSGEMETACELIGTDAEVNARSYDGRAPLMYAAMAGHAGIVAALIAAARSR